MMQAAGVYLRRGLLWFHASAQTVAVGIVVIGAVGAAVAVAPVTVTVLATGALVYAVGDAIYDRAAEGQTLGQSIGGGLADVSGVAGIYSGLSDKDIATRQKLNQTAAERGQAFGSGTATVALWFTGGKVYNRGKAWGNAQVASSAGGKIPGLKGLDRAWFAKERAWVAKGSENVPLFRSLGRRKALYEEGQRVVPKKVWLEHGHYTEGLTGKAYVRGAIRRGIAYRRDFPGWKGKWDLLSLSPADYLASLSKGMTPRVHSIAAPILNTTTSRAPIVVVYNLAASPSSE